MYSFQEVHEYDRSWGSRSRWDIIHEVTGLRTRYYGKTEPPVGHVYPWVFNTFYAEGLKERVQIFCNGKKLPMLKVNMCSPVVSLGICPTVTTTCNQYSTDCTPQQEQGIKPMRAELNTTSAVATIINAESETAKQRDFLLKEFRDQTRYEWQDEKVRKMVELFNLNAPKYPKTSQELLDAFANGKFTVDQKKVDLNAKHYALVETGDNDDDYDYVGQAESFYGITFTDLPVADRKGYDAALKSYQDLKKDTERSIVIGSPADGLAALKAFEAWMPTATATVQ